MNHAQYTQSVNDINKIKKENSHKSLEIKHHYFNLKKMNGKILLNKRKKNRSSSLFFP